MKHLAKDSYTDGQEGSEHSMRQDDPTQDKGRRRLFIHEEMGHSWTQSGGGADNHNDVETPGQEVKFLKREGTVTTKQKPTRQK